VTLTLPKFTYDLDLRKTAAGMLKPERAESPVWGHNERLALSKAYENAVSAALPGVTVKDSGTIENYPREAVQWILESRDVRTAVNKP
jgi:hypothetical protein